MKIGRHIELVANILIVVVSVLVVGVFIYKYLLPVSTRSENLNASRDRGSPSTIQIGQKVTAPGISFADSPKTVLLALQTTCHFCNDSIPFYRQLVEEAKRKKIKLIAVFPTDVNSSSQHLTKSGITDFEVYQVPLTAIEVAGTPTLLIVGSGGEVMNVWVGRLSPEKEREVLSQLN